MIRKLVKLIGDYTKTDILSLARNASWITGGNIANKALGIVLAYLFANYVSKDVYGTYKYVLSVASTFLIFTLTGVNTAVIRSVVLGFEGAVRAAFKTKFRWSLLGSAAAFIAATYYFYEHNSVLGASMLIVAVFFPFFETPTLYASFLNGRKLFKEDTLADLSVALGYAAAMSITMLLTQNLFILLIVYFASQILFRNIVYAFVVRRFKPNDALELDWLSYGKHLSLMEVLVNVANYIDKIILFHVAGPIDVAIYSFASAIPEQFKIFHSFIPIIGFPAWSNRSSEDLQKSFQRKMLVFFAESVFLILVYLALAPLIFKIFFPLYLEAIPLSQVYMLSFLNFAPSFILPALQARSRIRELYFFNVTTSILQILLLVAGGFYYGLWGIVIARVLGRIGMTLIAFAFYKKI